MTSSTSSADRVGFGEKLALGVGGLPMFLGLAAIGSFATPFYQMTLKLDPVWLAAALTVPRFLDALRGSTTERILRRTICALLAVPVHEPLA